MRRARARATPSRDAFASPADGSGRGPAATARSRTAASSPSSSSTDASAARWAASRSPAAAAMSARQRSGGRRRPDAGRAPAACSSRRRRCRSASPIRPRPTSASTRSGTHGMIAGLGRVQPVQPGHRRFEVPRAPSRSAEREVDEPKHGVIPGGVEPVVVGLGEPHAGRRLLPRLVDPSEQRPRPGLVEEGDMALRRGLAGLLDDVEALVSEAHGALEPTGAAFELRQVAEDLLSHDVHPAQLVLGELPLEDVAGVVEPAHPHELESEHQPGRRIDGAFRPRARGHHDLLEGDGLGRARPGRHRRGRTR